ncbi:hypothetical protein BKA70DRAFT_1462171 [Coprinopsis sp. MPI-PUGE-AT-0042]|nr:hypothetical protein BKA70DRAFT_1462171 [Coprinopsis sp. MPI-PUGE-AT-0042]
MPALNTELILELIDRIGYEQLLHLDHWDTSNALIRKKVLYNFARVNKACKWQVYPYLHGVLKYTSWQSVRDTINSIESGSAPAEVVKAHTVHLALRSFSWDESEAAAGAPFLKTLFASLPKLRKLVLDGSYSFSWKDHIGKHAAARDAIVNFLSSTRLESLEIRSVIIPRNLHRYFGPVLASLTMSYVTWDDGVTGGSFIQNPAPLEGIRSLRVESSQYQKGYFAIHELTGSGESSHGGAVSLSRLERVALLGTDPWERLTIKALLQAGSFPELKTIVVLNGLDAFDRKGVLPNLGTPDIGIPMDDLHTKFECITLPTYYLSGARIEEFPDRLEMFLVCTNTQSKVKKLILNLCSPSPGFRGSEKANKGPMTFGGEWVRINGELSKGAGWKGLEEVVLDMSGEKPRDWNKVDIERIGEYLGTVSLPGLASTVKLTVLT